MADMIDYQKLLEMWRDEKQKRQTAEGELSIIKGIGNNSPEMKSLQAQVEELKKEMALVREQAQIDILNLEKRIPELVQRINDLVKVNENRNFKRKIPPLSPNQRSLIKELNEKDLVLYQEAINMRKERLKI